jgi:hypothetical protein
MTVIHSIQPFEFGEPFIDWTKNIEPCIDTEAVAYLLNWIRMCYLSSKILAFPKSFKTLAPSILSNLVHAINHHKPIGTYKEGKEYTIQINDIIFYIVHSKYYSLQSSLRKN